MDSTGVTLWSRRGNLFTKQFPQIAQACERLAPGTLVDGEIVALDENGRISFHLLQDHRSKTQALLFYVFRRAGISWPERIEPTALLKAET